MVAVSTFFESQGCRPPPDDPDRLPTPALRRVSAARIRTEVVIGSAVRSCRDLLGRFPEKKPITAEAGVWAVDLEEQGNSGLALYAVVGAGGAGVSRTSDRLASRM